MASESKNCTLKLIILLIHVRRIQVFHPCVQGPEEAPTRLLTEQRHSGAAGINQVKSSLMNYKLNNRKIALHHFDPVQSKMLQLMSFINKNYYSG